MSARTRANLFCRLLLATAGGYLLASLWAASISVLLPIPRHEAVMIASMTAFMVFPAYAIWTIYCASLKRLLVGSSALLLLLSLFLVLAGNV